MYLVLSIINYALLIAILIIAGIIFYRTLKEKPTRRWFKAAIFAIIISLACILIDENILALIAFIGFYSLVFAILAFILLIYFTAKQKLDEHRIWITLFIIFLILFIVGFAVTGVFIKQ